MPTIDSSKAPLVLSIPSTLALIGVYRSTSDCPARNKMHCYQFGIKANVSRTFNRNWFDLAILHHQNLTLPGCMPYQPKNIRIRVRYFSPKATQRVYGRCDMSSPFVVVCVITCYNIKYLLLNERKNSTECKRIRSTVFKTEIPIG